MRRTRDSGRIWERVRRPSGATSQAFLYEFGKSPLACGLGGGVVRNDDGPNRTRRALLGSTASLGAAALAGCTGNGGSGATTTTSTEETTRESTTQQPMAAPDVPVLNYAIALEPLEATFYVGGVATFSDDEFMQADVLAKFDEWVRMDVPKYLKQIRDHEAAHVSALTDTIEKLNGEAVGRAEYDFGYSTPSEFSQTARAFENLGVAASTGAAPMIVNDDVAHRRGGHPVEARHAAFRDLVNGETPFPKAVQEAKSMGGVLETASNFVTWATLD